MIHTCPRARLEHIEEKNCWPEVLQKPSEFIKISKYKLFNMLYLVCIGVLYNFICFLHFSQNNPAIIEIKHLNFFIYFINIFIQQIFIEAPTLCQVLY